MPHNITKGYVNSKATAHGSDDPALGKAHLQLKSPTIWVNLSDESAGEDLYDIQKDVYVASDVTGYKRKRFRETFIGAGIMR